MLDAALEMPPDAWPELLERMCGDDPEVRREARDLLRRYSDLGGFLQGEPVAPAPERIGAYRVLRLIARGGMGDVYLAERSDGQFDRRVALKLLPPGPRSPGIERRFRTERQILAGLEHPSIARLLDGGVTDRGRPYLVMEYVEGNRLDVHCDERKLTVRERLRLFLDVVDAVDHAHRRLIVHRDLKPSNIHVTAEGRVKLLDFGIAKLLEAEDETTAPVTRTGHRFMTPEYAAPEQVEGEPVTTATDVYQLGILLYHLVSGRLPFTEAGSLHRLERAILEEEPRKPSTVASRPAGAAAGTAGLDPRENARARSTRPARLRGKLRGDLDAIVLKALRKEPAARYASVSAMATDIRRYLQGRPVRARRGTIAYRTGKFLRRHRGAVSAAAAFVLLLAGYAATVTVQAARIREALADARVEAEKAEQVSTFLIGLFGANEPGEALGDTVTARELLERGVARADELSDQPEVQARMLDEMGRVYESLGRYDRAEPLLRRALELRSSLYGEAHIEVAKSLDNVATLLQRRGRYEEAESLFRRALDVRRGLPDPEAANVDVGLNNLALLLRLRAEYEEAERLYRQSLDIKRERYGDHSRRVATALHNLGSMLRQTGDAERAEPLFRRSLEVRREQLGDEHPLVAETLDHLGALLLEEGDPDGAEPLLRAALDIRRNVLGEEHPDVTTTLFHLAGVLRETASYGEAEALARDVLARDRRQLGERHPEVAHTLVLLARIHLERDEAAAAEPLLREAVDIRRDGLSGQDWRVAAAEGWLGQALADLGRHGEAERLLRRSHLRLRNVFGPDDRRVRRAAERLTAVDEVEG